ncbi:hypothetical protein Prum_035350 [Phytohabitans rumicis]|uniref:Uncharacterized protein n=1 Tax=Phytohabitans rumicis TaxID=1076125 RepID=A0A6V8KXS4_9ACTN|nr:hypothetical protein Prum_035350 [Phytohabitans rumicis]
MRSTSACAPAGTAGSWLSTSGHTIVPPSAAAPPLAPSATATWVDSGALPPPAVASEQVASPPRLVGLVPWRPMEIAIRSIVAVRLSASGPRIAFCTKFAPPWPALVASLLLASAICVFSRARFRDTSACADAGTAGSLSATLGQLMVDAEALPPAAATPMPTPAKTTAAPAVAITFQRRPIGSRPLCCLFVLVDMRLQPNPSGLLWR